MIRHIRIFLFALLTISGTWAETPGSQTVNSNQANLASQEPRPATCSTKAEPASSSPSAITAGPNGPALRTRQAEWFTGLCLTPIPLDPEYTLTREWVSQAISWWFHQDDAPDGQAIIDKVFQLPPDQSKSPVVQLLLGMLKLEINGQNKDDGTLLAAWKKLPSNPNVPAGLVWTASAVQNKLGGYDAKLHPTEFAKTGIRALVRALKKECYYDEDKWLALSLPTRGMLVDLPYDATENYDEVLAEAPEPIRDLLLGHIEIERAWSDRGGGYANTVSEKGWEGFRSHLAKAREFLTRSFVAAPNQPYAAAHMIQVCQGQQSTSDEMNLWLNRTLAVQSDHFTAWVRYMDANLSRWGGSEEILQNIALDIARQIDWKSDLPLIFEKSLEFLVYDTKQPRSVLLQGDNMRRAFRLFLDSIPKSPPESATSGWLRGNMFAFMNACHARQYDDARAVMERIGADAFAKWYRPANGRLVYSPATLNADIVARSGESGRRFVVAESAQAAGLPGAAAPIFNELADSVNDAAAKNLLRHHARCAGFEDRWGGNNAPYNGTFIPFEAIQGAANFENEVLRLTAKQDESAIAVLWLSSKSAWELKATFDTGDQPDATTGVFWGSAQVGNGLSIGSPRGWARMVLAIPLRQLTNEDPGRDYDTVHQTAEREFTLRWNGTTLNISCKVGSKVWTRENLQVDEEPGVWMLAIMARAKESPLKGTVLRNLSITPLTRPPQFNTNM